MSAVNINPNFFNHDAQAGGFFPVTHINPGFDIDAFISGPGKNMLVEGIRGTGKTHVLKMISSRCIDRYPERKILPIYISLAKVSEWQGSDIRLFRIQLYASIVTSTLSIIEKEKARIAVQKRENGTAIETIKRMFGLKGENDIDELMKRIKSLNDTLIGQLTYIPDKILNKTKAESQVKSSFSAGEKVQVTLEDFFANLKKKKFSMSAKR